MDLKHIDHYTLCCAPEELPSLRHFYSEVLQLTEGPRPNFSFPGHWMYAGGRPIVHLAALATRDTPPMSRGLRVFAPARRLGGLLRGLCRLSAGAGRVVMIKQTIVWTALPFRTSGLQGTRTHLNKLGVKYAEAPVPDFPLHQVFLRDPMGVKVELTFDLAEVPMDDPARKMTGDAAMVDI